MGLIALTIGITGYTTIEGFSFVEALYMTIITLSTVGFNEVKPLSPNGEIFTSFLIIFNIGIFAYVVTTFSRFVLEGGIQTIFNKKFMEQKIKKLHDHVIICGFGKYGQEVAANFLRHQQPFVVIENQENGIEEIKNYEGILFVAGDATDDDILIKAGIDKCKSLISTLPEDTDNVYVTLTSRQLNPRIKIICRATYQKTEKKLKRAGADHVILLNRIGGSFMASLVTRPDAVEFFTKINEKGDEVVNFEEIAFDKLPAPIQNKTIRELDIRSKTGANVIGIKTKDHQFIVNPDANTAIEDHMRIIVLGTSAQIEAFSRYMKNLCD
jgi:voltage-gated potassium channel